MIRVTPARADEAADLARIHLTARAAAGDSFPPPVHADDEYLPHLLADVLPTAEVRVARDGEQVLGFLVLQDGLLADLYVAPEAQGRGVGSVLLDDAKALRPGGLILWVFTSNAPARTFYEGRGFVVVGGSDGDNEERAPDLLLRWRPATP